MRIGILTYHAVCNFGANLQTLSTVEILKKKGYEPIVINWIPFDLEESYKKNTPASQFQIHQEFVQKYLPISDLCRTDDDIVDLIERYNLEGVIIGSDAVVKIVPFWARVHFPTRRLITVSKSTSTGTFPNPFWGSFLSKFNRDIPAIMMSVSSQNAEYRKIFANERKNISKSLIRFNYISVRDLWTQRMIKYLTYDRLLPKITPDPVFAFNQNAGELLCSRDEILKKYKLPEKYILMSFKTYPEMKSEWVKKFKELVNQKGFRLVGLPMPQGFNDLGYDLNIQLPLSPLDWYSVIKYSSGYVGHNMHPIIVSIHNAVPFFSFDYYGILNYHLFLNIKSSKIFDLLSRIGLAENMHNVIGAYKKHISPEYVFGKIFNFNFSRCKELSASKYLEYQEMMMDIDNIFISRKIM